MILMQNANPEQRTAGDIKPLHVVSERDSDTYEDIITVTQVNGENE